jgi:hypothetical protein
MSVPEWPPRPPLTDTDRVVDPAAQRSRGRSTRIDVSVLLAEPTVSLPSSSLSRFSSVVPLTSEGSSPLAPSPGPPTSSFTVISNSRRPCGSDASSASAIIAAIPMPSSAPSVVPAAVSQSPSRSSWILPSAGSFGLSGSRSHTMSR